MSAFSGNSDLGLDLDYPVTTYKDLGVSDSVTLLVGLTYPSNLGYHLYSESDAIGRITLKSVYFDPDFLIADYSIGDSVFNDDFPRELIVSPAVCDQTSIDILKSLGCLFHFDPEQVPDFVYSDLRSQYDSPVMEDMRLK